MSKHFLVLQHIEIEHPGFFRDLMKQANITWDTIHLDKGQSLPTNVSDYSGVLSMGGPMDVWEKESYSWIHDEESFIREWVLGFKKPFLGICLGHQLLATALGGKVEKAKTAEVGIHSISLTDDGRLHGFFKDCPREFACLQWHGAEVVVAPTKSKVLASSRDCQIQSLAIGNYAFSFQFHLEITPATVDEWAEVEAYRISLESELGRNGLKQFREDAAIHLSYFNSLAKQVFNNWLKISLLDSI